LALISWAGCAQGWRSTEQGLRTRRISATILSVMKRVAQVIRLKPEQLLAYKQLHIHTWQGVLDRIRASNIRNYSIYLHGDLLFSYFEYIGSDYAADMQAISDDEITQAWWSLCKPMQQPVPEAQPGEWWHTLEEVFHTP
jgi:L-rhamnose mutarotase